MHFCQNLLSKNALILFLFISNLIASQTIFHYNSDNGFPNDITYNFYNDDKGYIWFGTDDGLAKFDGKDFTVYTENNGLTNNYVIDVKKYNTDTLALATWGGGLHFLTNDTIFKPFKYDLNKINDINIFDRNIHSYSAFYNMSYMLKSNQDTVKSFIFDTTKKLKNGIYYNEEFYSTKIKSVKKRLFVFNRPAKDNKSKALKGIYIFEKNELKETFHFLKDKKIETLGLFSEEVFIASEKDSIFLFDEHKILDKRKLSVQDLTICKIVTYSKNELLVLAANEKGFKDAFLYNLSTQKTINFRTKYNIEATISDIGFDFENNIWLTTFGDGVYQLSNNNFNIKNILHKENIIKIEKKENSIYALTTNKLIVLEKEKATKKHQLSGFGKNLFLIDDKVEVRSIKLKKERNISNKITEKKGVFAYKDDELIINAFEKAIINNTEFKELTYRIQNVCKLNGVVYIASDYGLYEFNIKKQKISKSRHHQFLNTPITDVVFDGNYLWISTSKGLFKIRENEIETYTTNNGLISNNIKDLLVSTAGKLWLATPKGLSMFDGVAFINFTKEEGLISNNINALLEDKQSNLWVATSNGISIFKDQKEDLKHVSPKINITQDKSEFKFDVISYSNPNTLFTQYQINNEPWETSTTNFYNFKNFKEGNYTFKVRSKKPNSNWTYSKTSDFKISIPIYKKPAFIIFSMLIFCLGIVFIVLYRLQKSKKQNLLLLESIEKQKRLEERLNSVRENIAQDFHDDLGNKLATITVLTDVLSTKTTSTSFKNTLDQIQESSDSLYKGTRDFIWSLKSKSNELEELITYLSDFGEDFFHKLNIDFNIEKDVEENIELPYYWSRHIILIFKELMTNAAKHSNCTACIIDFQYHKNSLKISLTDNGKGFSIDEIKHQNGILNIKNRVTKINSSIDFQSSKKGTKVIFEGNTTHKR